MRFVQLATKQTFDREALFALCLQTLVLSLLRLYVRTRNLGSLLLEIPNVTARFALFDRWARRYRLRNGSFDLRVQTNGRLVPDSYIIRINILGYDFELGSDLLADEFEQEELPRHVFFSFDQVFKSTKVSARYWRLYGRTFLRCNNTCT